jgi:short-subunit dehydrogenase
MSFLFDKLFARWNPQGASAIVTGASSGIGKELAIRLVREGCLVFAVARRTDRLELLAREHGERWVSIPGDITQEEFRSRLFSEVDRQATRLNLLVNGAGIGALGPFESATTARAREVFEVNFFAPLELTRLAIPRLKRFPGSVICNISSVLGHCAAPYKSEYVASKFALHGWSDALRAELAGCGIQVTLISPSTTDTEFFDMVIDGGGSSSATGFSRSPALLPRKGWRSMSPTRVAGIAMRGVRGRRNEVILSITGKLAVWFDRLSPPMMAWLLAILARRESAREYWTTPAQSAEEINDK